MDNNLILVIIGSGLIGATMGVVHTDLGWWNISKGVAMTLGIIFLILSFRK